MRSAGMKHWPYTVADSKTASAAVASAAGSLAATATASQDSALKRRMPGEQGAKPSWGRGGKDNGTHESPTFRNAIRRHFERSKCISNKPCSKWLRMRQLHSKCTSNVRNASNSKHTSSVRTHIERSKLHFKLFCTIIRSTYFLCIHKCRFVL